MRAATVSAFGAPDGIALQDWPEPVPGPGQALAVEVVEVNYPDLLVLAGRYHALPPLPYIPRKTAVGHVLTLGPDTDGPAIGARVVAAMELGAFAERALAFAACCLRWCNRSGVAWHYIAPGKPQQNGFA